MAKLTRRHLEVLRFLARVEGWVAAMRLPDGNGRFTGASAKTLKELRDRSLVEYGKAPGHSLYGYRATEAGRAVLTKEESRAD